MTWPQQLALVFGVIYTLIGVIGFFITGFGDFFGNMNGSSMSHDHTLLGFMINPAHNVVHILIGVVGIALSRTLKGARTYGLLLLVGYGALNLMVDNNSGLYEGSIISAVAIAIVPPTSPA